MSDATIPELGLGAALFVASFLLFSTLKRLLIDEVVGWLPIFTSRLARAASAFVPLEHKERYRDEWLAELGELRDRKLYALLWAVRVLFRSWATRPGQTRARKAEAPSTPVPPPSLAEATDSARARVAFELLIADVQALPESQRTALLMREIDALSYEHIAEAMETTVPSVKSLLVRARVGLAQAAEARLLSCDEVRVGLADAAEGIAKVTPAVRRHVGGCERCRAFRTELRGGAR